MSGVCTRVAGCWLMRWCHGLPGATADLVPRRRHKQIALGAEPVSIGRTQVLRPSMKNCQHVAPTAHMHATHLSAETPSAGGCATGSPSTTRGAAACAAMTTARNYAACALLECTRECAPNSTARYEPGVEMAFDCPAHPATVARFSRFRFLTLDSRACAHVQPLIQGRKSNASAAAVSSKS